MNCFISMTGTFHLKHFLIICCVYLLIFCLSKTVRQISAELGFTLNAVAVANGSKISLMETSLVCVGKVKVALYGGAAVVLMDAH